MLAVAGCEMVTSSSGNTGVTPQAAKKQGISGKITSAQTILASLSVRPEQTATNTNGVPGAKVWLEDSPEFKATSDVDGMFFIENAPPGNYRIVASIKDLDDKIFKQRSDVFTLAEETTDTGTIQLVEAKKVIRGTLRDSNGNPIVNATLRLWGEIFQPDLNGVFVTPPLPADITEAFIKVESAFGLKPITFTGYFSDNFTPDLELTLVKIDSSAIPPVIQLSTPKSTLAPREQINFTVTVSDPDEPDLSQRPVEWQAIHGILNIDTDTRSASWIAPDDNITATITASITDSTGLTSRSSLTMQVGVGGAGNQRPTVANVRIENDADNFKVSFDLADLENDLIDIKVFYSTDSGATFLQTLNIVGTTSQLAPLLAQYIIWKPGLDVTAPAQQVIIRILPSDSRGDGVYKQSSPFALNTNNVAPQTAPANFQVIASNSTNLVSWEPAAGADHYDLYWGNSAETTRENGNKISDISSPYLHSGLVNGLNYYYLIYAVNVWGSSPVSTVASGRPLPPAPLTPTGLAAQAATTSITLTWNSAEGASSYRIYWSTQPGVNKTNGTIIDNVQSPYHHTGLIHDTTCYYVVSAVNIGGESSESTEVSGKVDSQPPQITLLNPSNQSYGNATATKLAITFDEPVSAGTGHISIYRADGVLHEELAITSANILLSGAQITITPSSNLTDDTFYYVLIGSEAVLDSYGNKFAGLNNATDWRFKTMFEFNETMQWNVTTVNASAAWKYSTGEGVIVAVIDTGVESSHPELAGQLVSGGYDLFNDGIFLQDGLGHGTHVAGIIAARSKNSGVIGIAPRSKLYISKVFSMAGVSPSADEMVSAIQDAVSNGAKVINMSIGTTTFNSVYEDVAAWARAQGVLIFAAAGNDSSTLLRYLAACPSVVAVGATDQNDAHLALSNYSPELDYSAPGEQILSIAPGASYGQMSGTSMATAHVSALAALIWAKNPDFSPEQVLDAITYGALDLGASGRDSYFGYGRIDALKSIGFEPGITELSASLMASAKSALPGKSDFTATDFKPGELLVRLQAGKSLNDVLLSAQLETLDIRQLKSFQTPGLALISVPAGQEIEIGRKLQNIPEVVYADLNTIISFY